jgi:molybdopterin biosynthesis enzyme
LKARPLVGETESTKVISSADGFIMVPEDVESLFEGQIVDVQLVPGLWRLPSRSKGAG